MSPKKSAKADEKKAPETAVKVKKATKAKKTVKRPVVSRKKTVAGTKPSVASPSSASAPLTSMATALPSTDVTYVIIDYPTEEETVSGLHYAIRIGASTNGVVELSINNGPWESCRYADGFWWYDWGYYLPGTSKLAARLVDEKGKLIKHSSARKCTVI